MVQNYKKSCNFVGETMRKIDKRKPGLPVLLFTLLFYSLAAFAGPVDDFRKSPGVTSDESAVLVIDLRNGKVVESHNASKPLIPASIMKCVTTAGLLEISSPGDKYKTEVGYTGRLDGKTLRGDLVVIGSGDPSLNSSHVADNGDICVEIAGKLKSAGINRIEGAVLIDESVFSGPAVPPSWSSGDLPHSYGTGQHGFNFEDNSRGKSSVKNPSEIFMTRLDAALRREGITITGISSTDKNAPLTKLFTHESVPFDEIMRSCMMRSDNQYAESMLRTIAVRNGEKGSTANGARDNTEFWKKKRVPMEGVSIVDGSGLSRSNRVTAEFMAGVLRTMKNNPWYASFFPLAGQEGTLKNFLCNTPLEGYIAMKTGSMNGIQCYAGYKVDEDYEPTHAVVIMMNKMGNRSTARAAAAKMLLEIFGYGDKGE